MYDPAQIQPLALAHGFERRGQRNWVRRTADFVQVVNLQGSQWAKNEYYLNFALWALAFGEPPSMAERKFHFRTRAEHLGGGNLEAFFSVIDREYGTLNQLRLALATGKAIGLLRHELSGIIAAER